MSKSVKLGRYRHYKGNDYQLLHIAKHSETEELLAIYSPLYGDEKMQESIWARPLNMFTETIYNDKGERIERFTYIGG